MKPLKQNSESENDLPYIARALLFCVKQKHRSHTDTDRSNSGNIKRDQYTGDRGTDIGTKDNARCLRQIHDLCVDKAMTMTVVAEED